MREFKFRVWDKETKHMSPIRVWNFELGHIEAGTELQFKFREDISIMQLTGFLDAVGVEIWECDILASNTATNQLVEWDQPRGMWTTDGTNHPAGQLSHWAQESFVVGNKWENPELV